MTADENYSTDKVWRLAPGPGQIFFNKFPPRMAQQWRPVWFGKRFQVRVVRVPYKTKLSLLSLVEVVNKLELHYFHWSNILKPKYTGWKMQLLFYSFDQFIKYFGVYLVVDEK